MLKSIFRNIGVQDFIVFLGFFSLVTVQFYGFANDPGVGWHLKTGQLILNGEFPYFDPFLALYESRRWISDQWLGDLVLFSLYKAGGFVLIYAAFAVLFVWTFLVYSYRSSRDLLATALLSSIAVLLAFKLGQVHFILRPVLLSFPIFAFVYFYLARLFKDSIDRPIFRSLLVLFLVFLVWANTHPSFVLGLGLILVCGIAAFLLWLRKKDASNFTRFKLFLMIFVVGFLASLLNPNGYLLHDSIINLGSSVYFMNLHMEWQALNFSAYSGKLFIAIVCFVLLVCLGIRRVPSRVSLFEWFVFIGFAALSIKAIRFLPYFGIVSVTVLAGSMELFINQISNFTAQRFPLINKKLSLLERNELSSSSGSTAFVLLSVLTLGFALLTGRIPGYHGQFEPARSLYPYKEVEFLNQRLASDTQMAVLAPPEWGGFISFYGDGLKPVIDDRNSLVGEKFYKHYLSAQKSEEDWNSLLEVTGLSCVIAPIGTEMRTQVERDIKFTRIFEGNLASVYCED